MLLKLLVVFASCKGLLCNTKMPAPAESYYRDGEPEIINLDLVHEVKIGENVEIDCLATGNPESYKWSKELQDIVNTDRFTVFAENGTMRVISVEEADRGVYTCVASNSFGESEQNFAINVLVQPSIDEFENITIAEHTEGILTCKAQGYPAPFVTFSWYGWEFTSPESSPFRDVIPTQVVDEELGKTIATLNFTRALRSYYGEYGCSAENTIDSVKQITYVTIEYAPDFSYMGNPSPAYSYGRRPVNLSCVARALPEATIVWYWNDKLISDDPFFEVINSGSESTLVVEPVDDSYFTTYKCVASNKLGDAERFMELREAYPPEAIAEVMAQGWSTYYISFAITASFTGTPAEFYKYQYKEEAELDWIDSGNSTRVVMPVTTILVQGLKANTKYNFRFYAENELGTSPFVELSHQTMCQYRYEEPKILNKITEDRADGEFEFIESPYTDKFELIWEPIIEPCEEIVYYSIEYCLASYQDWKTPLAIYEGQCTYIRGITSNNYVIGNLTADTYYVIRLTGVFMTTSYHSMRTARDPITGGDPRLKIYPTHSVQNIAVGTFLSFTCKSKVESIANLIWRDTFDNPVNSKSSDGIMYTEAGNDGELLLVIPFVKHALRGTYYCTSAGGSETIETFVNLETYTLIESSDKLQFNFDVSGRDGYVFSSFYGVDDNTTVEWMFENNPIVPSDRYEFIVDEYLDWRYYLIIRNLTESDEGFYTCRKSTNERRIYFEVLLEPSILNIETEYSAVEGVDFAMDCQSHGKPAPIVKWIDQNGADVTLNSRFSVNRSGQMKIGHVEKSDEGRYTCDIRSIVGMSKKTVQLKVEIEESDKNQGKSVHEYCIFTVFICSLLYTIMLL